jgi:hypothetical protein
MNAIPLTALTREIAQRIIWFEPPEQALAEPIRFMAYAMTYALHEDMQLIRRYVTDDDIREALDQAPPGIIDPRSWAYWNSKMGRYPAPPLPVRRFVASVDAESHLSAKRHHGVGSKRTIGLAEIQLRAREAWKRMRGQQPSKFDLEEVRRQARENWRNRFGNRK